MPLTVVYNTFVEMLVFPLTQSYALLNAPCSQISRTTSHALGCEPLSVQTVPKERRKKKKRTVNKMEMCHIVCTLRRGIIMRDLYCAAKKKKLHRRHIHTKHTARQRSKTC